MDESISSSSSSSSNKNKKKRKIVDNANDESTVCPYLDTINRTMLDFDFEFSCSVSLETGSHIYACCVCGKYFRGRSSQTPAYTHSVNEQHYVFLHLSSSKPKFYCLPDNYVVNDPSLDDIKAALYPTYTDKQIATIESSEYNSNCRDLYGRLYIPGYVGLNNLNKTDCINSIVQALVHVPPLRDYFLRQQELDALENNVSGANKKKNKSSSYHKLAQQVVLTFGELCRKVWSNQRFKTTIDPHQFVQAISVASHKKFGNANKQCEAGELMTFILNQLHVGLGGSSNKKKSNSSIIQQAFQGQVRVTTRQLISTSSSQDGDDVDQEDDRVGSDNEEEEEEEDEKGQQQDDEVNVVETTNDTNFLQLTLDIPEKPLFRDQDGGLVIPQEPLINVLKKFDGITFSDAINSAESRTQKRYQLRKLPNYLILHITRFRTNKYSREKNPTIVAFPVKNLDLSNYVHHHNDNSTNDDDKNGSNNNNNNKQPPSETDIRNMSVKDIKKLLKQYGRSDIVQSHVDKMELVNATIDFVCKPLPDLLIDKYDLIANITHESPPDVGREGTGYDPLQMGHYKCHVLHRSSSSSSSGGNSGSSDQQSNKQWYEIQDLHVQEIMPQQIGLSESYLLIFERQKQQQQSK